MSINLNCTNIGKKSVQLIATMLSSLDLVSLDLNIGLNSLRNKEIAQLLKALNGYSKLQCFRLNISENRCSKGIATDIFNSLKNMKKINEISIELQDNDIPIDDLVKLANNLKDF